MALQPFARIVDLGDFLQRDLKAFTETELRKEHARVAREARDEVLNAATPRPDFTTTVDGRTGANEDSVKPLGEIRYRFQYWGAILQEALQFATQLSPVLTGAHRDSWFLMADGVPVKGDWWKGGYAIPEATEYTITNDQPYHRIIEVGKKGKKKKFRAGHHIAEKTAVMVRSRFGNSVQAEVRFLNLRAGGSGRADIVPWIIKKGGRAGSQVTYPAVVLRAR
jgi:hypothetical protein